MEKKRLIILSILIVALIIMIISSLYFTFFYSPVCNNYECFKSAMEECRKTSYINEEPEASWGYRIKGAKNNECVVEVKLLQAKKGQLNIQKLQGFAMDCSYPLGISAYPEKDLNKCHGRLKEELQAIIISKLHSYILENLGQLAEGLKSAV